MGPRTIKKCRPVSCPNLPSGRPYFENNMNNIQDTAFLDTSSERYCPWGHFECKNSSTWSFWSKIWAKEGPIYTQFSIFATDKIGFYHNFISLLWQNYSFDSSEFFCGIRYIGLVILNSFLFCKYLINSWNGEKPRIVLFHAKKHEKSDYPLQLRRIFQDPPMIRKSWLWF